MFTAKVILMQNPPREQWNNFAVDLQHTLSKSPPNTDTVFMGDINARFGSARSTEEAKVIGRFGESNENRNTGGRHAIEFFLGCNLVCLSGRTPCEHPPYTLHGRAGGHSLIDIIAVSSSMWRKEYEGKPIETTLTGKEDHLPVIAEVRMTRKHNKKAKRVPKMVWNFQALKSNVAQRNSEKKGTKSCPASPIENVTLRKRTLITQN